MSARRRKIWGPLVVALGCLLPVGCSDDPAPEPDAAADLGRPDATPDRTAADRPSARPDGPLNVGRPCTADHHCSTGLTCDTTQPGGMCTRPCKADADCTVSSAGCHAGWCRPLCSPRAIIGTCRTDHVCRLDKTRGFCIGRCQQIGCKAGWTCDKDSGLCIDPKAGGIGAACGLEDGTCEGTPNGICIMVHTNYKAFCTVPCAPFTKACPTQFAGAYCAASKPNTEYCVFVCDPKKPDSPKCPDPKMTCITVGKNYNMCLPK